VRATLSSKQMSGDDFLYRFLARLLAVLLCGGVLCRFASSAATRPCASPTTPSNCRGKSSAMAMSTLCLSFSHF
jgi:hypothetical protein